VRIPEANQFKRAPISSQVIVTAVRWYLRYLLAGEHVTELLIERGLPVDASSIWYWTQAYVPELSKPTAFEASEQELPCL
jgi:transposase-like protein